MPPRFLLIALICTACSGVPGASQIQTDNELTGTWIGEHIKKDGTIKSWKQIRYTDGTFEIFYSYKHDIGGNHQTKDQGKWWLSNGQFFELNTEWAIQAFVYDFEFYTSDCIKFTQIDADTAGAENDNYQFTECRSTQTSN